ncbi:MAG: MBL fold metallo-hydrolase [Chloroflexota bacterium]|nr:MBL fold metallo-hydrolase [Chloroflexota bacterium]
MRLTVLGGSAAGPNAGMGCSGYLIDSGSIRLVLDFGPGILPELRRHTDFRLLSAIVISHLHLDHMLDLLALRHALAYNPRPAPGPIPVWLPPAGADLLAQATAPFDTCDEPGRFARTVEVNEYDPGTGLAIGDLRVSFAPTVHYVPGYAMRITNSSGQSIGYTGDTGPTADLADFFAGVNILVAESTLLDGGPRPIHERGSLTAAEAGDLARNAGASMLVLTHLWEEIGFAHYRERAAATFSGRIELARPGVTIDFG